MSNILYTDAVDRGPASRGRVGRSRGRRFRGTAVKFTLVFDGDLPASGNRSKLEAVWDIRNQLSEQLDALWATHRALRTLHLEARRPRTPGAYGWADFLHPGKGKASPFLTPPEWEDLAAPLRIEGRNYRPLVRASFQLACALDILFLRGEDPGAVVMQGGDIDNRIKTLLDALRVPLAGERKTREPVADPLNCLLESDTLVSGLAIRTDRHLGATARRPAAVRLVIGVDIQVLEPNAANVRFIGG